MVSKGEGLLGIPELGVWGRGCHSGRDVSPAQTLPPSNYPHFSDLFTGQFSLPWDAD